MEINNHTSRSSSSSQSLNRVLSIQSHVVYGYVGNKSATFPLQVLGFDVDAINSVQFSNHTGYKHIKGQVLTDKELVDVFSGLEENRLLGEYSHLLTGYIGKDSFLREVAGIVSKLKAANPNLIYVCDPVMGDNGRMYVPESLLPIYKNEIIPLCDICTPNQYEVELLTDTKIHSEQDAWNSLKWFHNKGVATVAISSTDLGPADSLLAFLSHKNGEELLQYLIKIPKQGNGVNFIGTGDLFASLFLAHSTTSKDIKTAFENTTATLQSVIRNTLNAMPEDLKLTPQHIDSQQKELKLIQSIKEIQVPNVKLYASKAN